MHYGNVLIFKPSSLRIFQIERIHIYIFHYVICLQLRLIYFPEVLNMNNLFNDAINM